MTKTTKTIYLSGTCEWAKVRKPDEAFGNPAYKITVDLDKASKKTFKESGLQLEPKEIDGAFKVTFKREVSKQWPDGTVEDFGAPRVYSDDGKTEVPQEVLIGNGSAVTVKVEVFDTRKGKGHRLAAIRVEKLVEYKPEGADAKGPPVF